MFDTHRAGVGFTALSLMESTRLHQRAALDMPQTSKGAARKCTWKGLLYIISGEYSKHASHRWGSFCRFQIMVFCLSPITNKQQKSGEPGTSSYVIDMKLSVFTFLSFGGAARKEVDVHNILYVCAWIATSRVRRSPIEEQSAGAHAPAAMITFLALKVPLLVTTVTTSPGMISITL